MCYNLHKDIQLLKPTEISNFESNFFTNKILALIERERYHCNNTADVLDANNPQRLCTLISTRPKGVV